MTAEEVALLNRILTEVRALRAEVAELRQKRVDRPTLTIDEVKAILGCERSRVFDLLAEGRLRRAKRTGRKTLITRESVESYSEPQAPAAPAKRRRAPRSGRQLAELIRSC